MNFDTLTSKQYSKIKRLITALTSTEAEMTKIIKTKWKLEKLGYTWSEHKEGEYLSWKHKDSPEDAPTIVAHIDTVNYTATLNNKEKDIAPTYDELYVASIKRERASTNWYKKDLIIGLNPVANPKLRSLGADDRTGLTALREIIMELHAKKQQMPHIILFYKEEIGIIGARTYVKDHPVFKSSFVLELDRRNEGVVFYSTNNRIFIDTVVHKLNRNEELGSMSDIVAFQNEYNINAANIGCGMSREHSRDETVNVRQWLKSIRDVVNLLSDSFAVKLLGNKDLRSNEKSAELIERLKRNTDMEL